MFKKLNSHTEVKKPMRFYSSNPCRLGRVSPIDGGLKFFFSENGNFNSVNSQYPHTRLGNYFSSLGPIYIDDICKQIEPATFREDWVSGDEFYIISDPTNTKQVAYNLPSSYNHNCLSIAYNNGNSIISALSISTRPLSDKEKEEHTQKLVHLHDYVNEVVKRPLLYQSDLLSTNNNFVKLYDLNDKYLGDYNFQQCCAFTKNSVNLMVYIPTEWCNYFGYTVEDLDKWLSFLNKLLGETVYTFKEVSSDSAFKPAPTGLIHSCYPVLRLMKNQFYVIHMKGSSSQLETYFRFILLRYFYNNFYNSIPRVCFDIQSVMPQLSNWKTLLLSLASRRFEGYYSLTSFFVPNINQKLEDVLDKFGEGGKPMNSMFEYTSYVAECFEEEFKNREYEKIYKILSNDK
jgi:hypothetical protein